MEPQNTSIKSSNYITDHTNFSLVAKSPFWMEHKKVIPQKHTQNYHYHDCYELYYLYSGERYYFIKDKTYHITHGHLVLINSYYIHCTTNAGNHGFDRMLINFKKEFLDDLLFAINDVNLFECFHKNIHIIKLNAQEQHYVENLLHTMMNEYTSKEIGYIFNLKTMLLQLLLFMNRRNNQLESTGTDYMNPTHKVISEITGYININYAKNITLHNTSEIFYLSPCYLSRTFKKFTGFSFVEYLNDVRIKEAKRLLQDTELSITEIAESVGYKSTTHFDRIFKNTTGISPLTYRKR